VSVRPSPGCNTYLMVWEENSSIAFELKNICEQWSAYRRQSYGQKSYNKGVDKNTRSGGLTANFESETIVRSDTRRVWHNCIEYRVLRKIVGTNGHR
jgi:hypothetical protein